MSSKHLLSLQIMFVLFFISLCASSTVPLLNKDNHYDLTNQTLPNFISHNANVMLYFHTVNCKQCMATDIQYGRLAKYINNTNSSISKYGVKLAKIDGNQYKDIAQKYGVTRYPALFYFDHTFAVRYRAGGTAKDIDQWIQ